MSLKRIKNSILTDARKEAERIVEDAKERLQEKVRDEKSKIEEGLKEKYTRDSKRFNSEFINKNSKKDNLVLDKKNIDIKGGFILRTARFEIDHTLDTILSNLRIELAPLIASELFSE
jgi:vacuolar-type H+-ATPase subunit E/Vma4